MWVQEARLNRSMGDILKQKSLSLLLGAFGCLMIVAGFFQVDDITKFKVTVMAQVAWRPVAAGAFLLACSFLTAFFFEKNTINGGIQNARLQEIPSREAYIDETVEQVNRSQTISMCVHTLAPSGSSGRVLDLQNALAGKTGGVRLIAPMGEERVEASVQLSRRGVSVRHLALLQSLDISFAVFDSKTMVLPTKSGEHEQTLAGMTLHSTKLAEMLEVLLDDLWARFDAVPHADFVRSTVQQILEASPNLSLSAIAKRLSVDEQYLRGLLPAFGCHDAPPRVFFVIGRPCSGKTTIAEAVRLGLEGAGIRPEAVYYFNDYEALYERFREDKDRKTFAEAEHGGFAVRDFSVLDTVLQQANFRLKTALPFFRAFIVEFARQSYLRALLNFERSILENSTIIHVKCSPGTSRERNSLRHLPSSDHRTGYIPDYILDNFYATEDMEGVTALPITKIVEVDTDAISLSDLHSFVSAKLLVSTEKLKSIKA